VKSWFFKLFAAFLLILQIPLVAEAGRNDTYPTPLTCYVRSNGRVTTYVENNRSRVSGYISGNVDVVQLMNIYPSDGWIYGNYPTSRGKKYAWWRIEDIVSNVDFANYEARVNGKTDVYAKSDRRKYFGYVAATDKIIVVSEEGNMAQVIYPISGGYKMGWIDKNRIVRSSTPNNNRNITPAVNYPTGKTVMPADGWYRISPAHRPEKSLDIVDGATGNGANLQIWDWIPTQHQKFYLQNRGNGYYTIKSGHCEMYVDAQGGVPQNGENVWQYQYNGTAAQFWRFIDAGNGTVYIETKMQPGLSFDCAGGGRNNGTNVQLWTRGNVAWNKWILTSLFQPYQKVAQKQTRAYTNAALTMSNGNEYVSAGDNVTVLNEQGNAYYVRYPVRGGTKDRWVSKDIFNASTPSGNWSSKLNSKLANTSSAHYKAPVNTFPQLQCTWYAFGRMREVTGVTLQFNQSSGRHAKKWINMVMNCKIDNNLQEKCVGVTQQGGSGNGHVVFVEGIENGYVYYTDSNAGNSLKVKRLSVNAFKTRYTHYIHPYK